MNGAAQTFAVLLGGPLHGSTRWMAAAYERIEGGYWFTFGDEYVAIYYWDLKDHHRKAIAQQVEALRARDARS